MSTTGLINKTLLIWSVLTQKNMIKTFIQSFKETTRNKKHYSVHCISNLCTVKLYI